MDAAAYALASAIPATYATPDVETSSRASMPNDHAMHGQSVLADGTILVTGGSPGGDNVRLYDPSTDTWTTKADLPDNRYGHGQSTLGDGRVLITGGYTYPAPSRDCRIWDPSTNVWTQASNNYYLMRHGQSTLNDGTVLVSGGANSGNTDETRGMYLYDPVGDTWTERFPLSIKRDKHKQSTLDDGEVLLIGGYVQDNSSDVVLQYEVGSDAPMPGRAALLGYLAAT
jgi:N-acetylneuraminic acid mutarotase